MLRASGNASERIRARARVGDRQPGETANAAQQHTFGENLPNDAASAGAQSHAQRNLDPASGAARQHQVGDVGAGNQQHHGRKDHQHLQALARLLLQVLNSAAARREHHVHLGNDRGSAVGREQRTRVEPLAQRAANLALQCADVGAGADAADRVKPVRFRMMEDGAGFPATEGSVLMGIQNSGGEAITRSPKKPGGATPITVNGLAWMKTVEPTIEGSEAYWPCQALKLSTTVGADDGRVVAVGEQPPAYAFTPSVLKKIAGDKLSLQRFGSALPRRTLHRPRRLAQRPVAETPASHS